MSDDYLSLKVEAHELYEFIETQIKNLEASTFGRDIVCSKLLGVIEDQSLISKVHDAILNLAVSVGNVDWKSILLLGRNILRGRGSDRNSVEYHFLPFHGLDYRDLVRVESPTGRRMSVIQSISLNGLPNGFMEFAIHPWSSSGFSTRKDELVYPINREQFVHLIEILPNSMGRSYFSGLFDIAIENQERVRKFEEKIVM